MSQAEAAFTFFLANTSRARMSKPEQKLYDFFDSTLIPGGGYFEFETELAHGMKSTYDKACRCDRCRAANTAHQRRWRLRKRFQKNETTTTKPNRITADRQLQIAVEAATRKAS